jgi:carbonic anhydrase
VSRIKTSKLGTLTKGESSLTFIALEPMPTSLQQLLDNNRAWAQKMEALRPGFFNHLAQQQSPKYLWIGCSDSRVPANEITGLDPGEVFVHRNVANVVVHSDLNALSVIQFAVEQLKVEHIMVVGHYGCSGVLAATRGTRIGLADNWLRHVQDVRFRHRKRLDHLPTQALEDAMCEMNVIEQVGHVAESNVMQDAWMRGQSISVHGWIYGLRDGLLKDLEVSIQDAHSVGTVLSQAYKRYPQLES